MQTLAAEVGKRDRVGLKIVDRHSAVDTLFHDGDDLLRRVCKTRHFRGVPILFTQQPLADRRRLRAAAEREIVSRTMEQLNAAFEAACGRFDGSNFDELDELDRILVTIWGLEAEVNNGGFDQFYFNGAGDLAFFAPTALRLIGADRMADIAMRANELFGPDGPARSSAARQAQLFLVAPAGGDRNPWNELDRAFQSYPDDISELLIRYLRERGRLT